MERLDSFIKETEIPSEQRMLQGKLTEQWWEGRHQMYLSDSNQAQVQYTVCKNDHVPCQTIRSSTSWSSSQIWNLIFLHSWMVLVCSSRKDLLANPGSISHAVLWVTQDELLHPQTHTLPPLKILLTNQVLSRETAAKLSFACVLQSFHSISTFLGKRACKHVSAGWQGGEDTLSDTIPRAHPPPPVHMNDSFHWGAVYLVFTTGLSHARWQVLAQQCDMQEFIP